MQASKPLNAGVNSYKIYRIKNLLKMRRFVITKNALIVHHGFKSWLPQFDHLSNQLGYLLLLVHDDFVQLFDQVFGVGCLDFQIRQTLVDEV